MELKSADQYLKAIYFEFLTTTITTECFNFHSEMFCVFISGTFLFGTLLFRGWKCNFSRIQKRHQNI